MILKQNDDDVRYCVSTFAIPTLGFLPLSYHRQKNLKTNSEVTSKMNKALMIDLYSFLLLLHNVASLFILMYSQYI